MTVIVEIIDEFVFGVIFVISGYFLKVYPTRPEIGVFTMLGIVFIAVVSGFIDESKAVTKFDEG